MAWSATAIIIRIGMTNESGYLLVLTRRRSVGWTKLVPDTDRGALSNALRESTPLARHAAMPPKRTAWAKSLGGRAISQHPGEAILPTLRLRVSRLIPEFLLVFVVRSAHRRCVRPVPARGRKPG